MLHTKSQGHWPFGSGEDFWRVFTIYGRGGRLGQMTQTLRTNLFPHPTEAPYQIWLWLDKRFWRRSLNMVDGHRTDDRTCLYYKLTNEPKGSAYEYITLDVLTDQFWMRTRTFKQTSHNYTPLINTLIHSIKDERRKSINLTIYLSICPSVRVYKWAYVGYFVCPEGLCWVHFFCSVHPVGYRFW